MPPATPDLNIIDRFMEAFTTYIDTGFGLLGPDVAFLTTILIGIDVTLAALWWAMDGDTDILGRLIKKVLYVGTFAFIITRFQSLADIIYRSFAGLGITAGGGGLTADDLMHPGALAAIGFKAAHPLFDYASTLLGFPEFFGNFLNIAALLVAWLIVVLAFFILAIQLFVCVLEFKLTTLAGFTLVPFALWNKSSFLAERVLGNVISSGVKIMVLAVIVGIGTNFFAQSVAALPKEPGIADAMTLVLGALALFGLGIYGPGVAAGLVSGAPQLGAGAAVGTAAGAALALGGLGMIGGRAAQGGMAALRAGAAMGGSHTPPAAAGGPGGGSPGGGGSGGSGAGGSSTPPMGAKPSAGGSGGGTPGGSGSGGSNTPPTGANPSSGGPGGGTPGGGGSGGSGSDGSDGEAPGWARKLRSEQNARHYRQAAIGHIKDGDRPMGPANPDLDQKEE